MTNQYTHGHHESVLRSHAWRTVQNSAQYVVPFLSRGAAVLDVGCGPGTITFEFAERVAPGHVIGIDAAAAVVETARSTPGRRRKNLAFEVGDVYELNFPDDTFDVVHAHQVLQHLDDPVRALREMRRVVKRNGVVAVRDADYGAMRWFPEEPGLDSWLALYDTVARSNDAEPNAGRHLRSWARKAGFTGIDVSADTWCFANREDVEWWGDLWADRSRFSSFAEQARGRGFATEPSQNAIAAGWRRWMESPDAYFIVPNTELICRG